mmetsp:Transcript_15334/g.31808  ORF Transcript_15334/g.31808 Transcript_15334/m.31808 type:complete len:85 (+) Transcript_15334:617-871(+)
MLRRRNACAVGPWATERLGRILIRIPLWTKASTLALDNPPYVLIGEVVKDAITADDDEIAALTTDRVNPGALDHQVRVGWGVLR